LACPEPIFRKFFLPLECFGPSFGLGSAEQKHHREDTKDMKISGESAGERLPREVVKVQRRTQSNSPEKT
jgi:hypothetical protein